MKKNFESFISIKDVLTRNNDKIKEYTDLSTFYLGFCEHFLSYIDAYEILFKKKNYYACHAIERIMLDLYIKSRLFAEVENLEDFANWLWSGNEVKKYPNFQSIKGDLTDKKLCEYFDKQDNNEENWINNYTNRYKEMSNFVHPSKQAAIEYWKKHEWSPKEKKMLKDIQEDKRKDFERLASEVHKQLTRVCCKILTKQL